MTYALFSGCKIPYFMPEYGSSTRAVLKALDVDFKEPEFNCCGYPVRNLDFKAYLLQSARNLATAGQKSLDIITPCKCCFGSLRHAQHFLGEHPDVRAEISTVLSRENLRYPEGLKVRHLLSVLAEEIGLDAIGSRVVNPLTGLKIAAHYGCHVLRPSAVVRFDQPFSPTLFESLVEITGAGTVSWERRLECCGQPVRDRNPELSMKMAEKKIASAKDAGADYLCSACTYCQMQFQSMPPDHFVTPVLYSQLLGISLGITAKSLGLDRTADRKLTAFLAA